VLADVFRNALVFPAGASLLPRRLRILAMISGDFAESMLALFIGVGAASALLSTTSS
jgi:hypothetical protein